MSCRQESIELETYRAILRNRGIDDKQKLDDKKDAFDIATVIYRKDFANGKLVWTGSFFRDLLIYFILQHPLFVLISCGQAIPYHHPYSRKERIAVLVTNMMIAFLWEAAGASISSCNPASKTHKEFNFYFGYFILPFLISFCNKILVTVTVCTCCQNKSTYCRKFAEKLGHFILFLFFLAGLFSLSIGLVGIGSSVEENCYTWGEFFLDWFQGLAISWLGIDILILLVLDPFNFPCPKCGFIWEYPREKSKALDVNTISLKTNETLNSIKKNDGKELAQNLECVSYLEFQQYKNGTPQVVSLQLGRVYV